MATFQASKPVHYYSRQATEPLPVAGETIATGIPEKQPNEPIAVAGKADQPAGDALVSLKATYAGNRRMTRRLERAEKQLAESRLVPAATQAKKPTLVQQLVLKKMAKKMEWKLAPEQTKAITGNARLGLIIAGVGLILLLLGNGLGSILGLIALLAGGALFVYALLQE
ncbi:hypothetical protein J2I47_06290 [Fibrella sp. HMF5335]|uniref:DUF2335 domain-containing protein n=1 Tax=Fibrella rubiginis TaxID=2817060 RepID=A0A939GG34_9BACT|nr:hypothetical protein [Fibrella rubiginis]MBO0936150.1 hypothetical protein [Fibrella rubiginis]